MKFRTANIREIFIWGAFLISAYFAFIKKWDNSQLQEDKIRAEERIKSLEQIAKFQSHYSDSVKESNTAMKAVIEYQKNNPKIIEKKYVEVRNNVLNLSDDDKVLYLARRLSKKDSN